MTMRIGKRITFYRERRGWTQAQLAEKLGVYASAVSMWETGERKITSTYLVRVANALKVTPNDLLEFESTPMAMTKKYNLTDQELELLKTIREVELSDEAIQLLSILVKDGDWFLPGYFENKQKVDEFVTAVELMKQGITKLTRA